MTRMFLLSLSLCLLGSSTAIARMVRYTDYYGHTWIVDANKFRNMQAEALRNQRAKNAKRYADQNRTPIDRFTTGYRKNYSPFPSSRVTYSKRHKPETKVTKQTQEKSKPKAIMNPYHQPYQRNTK